MSAYGLIKASSRIFRSDTIADLRILNSWLISVNKQPIISYGKSVRALENSVALGIENIDVTPILTRSVEFYKSILIEITDKERKKFLAVNKTSIK